MGITPAYLSLLKKGLRPLTPPIMISLENYLSSLNPKIALHFLQPFYVSTLVREMKGEDLGIKELIEQFLVAREVEGKTRATIRFYQNNLERFLWWLETNGVGPRLCDIKAVTLRSFLSYVKNTRNRWRVGSTSSRELPSPATIDAYWRCLQSFFSWLMHQEIITASENPLRKIPRPKVAKKVVRDIPLKLIQQALSLWDVNTLLGARNIAIVLTLLDTGVRLGEISGIRNRDINLDSHVIIIFGKGQKERKVRLEETAFSALQHYLKLRETVDCDYLWVTAQERRLAATGIQTLIRRLCKLGGGVRWSPHSFRNTFAMNYIRARGDTFTLQILGGWEDLEMPRHYTRALQAEDAFEVHRRASPANQLAKSEEGKA